jgi:hypothetical protein
MDANGCYSHLRKTIFSISALNEQSFSKLISVFTPVELEKNSFFCREGMYPLHMGFLCQGLVYSYYQADSTSSKHIRGFFIPGMFLLPLPPFIVRNPSMLNFNALLDTKLLQAKFSELQSLMIADNSIERVINTLVNREWIVNREVFDAGLHLYNVQTRCRLFSEKYRHFISSIPKEDIMSYLQISASQYSNYFETNPHG